MSKLRRIEITFFRRTVVRYYGTFAGPQAHPYDDEDASHQGCDDSSQADELDCVPDQRQALLPGGKQSTD